MELWLMDLRIAETHERLVDNAQVTFSTSSVSAVFHNGLAQDLNLHVTLSTTSPARAGANGILTWSALATLGYKSLCEYNFIGDLVFRPAQVAGGLDQLRFSSTEPQLVPLCISVPISLSL